MVEEDSHNLEELKQMENSNSLNRQDWILFKSVYLSKRGTFQLCSCSLTKNSQYYYNLDEKKTFKAPHPAHELGEIHTRFKCSAKQCKKTYSAKDFLIAYLTSKRKTALGKRAREATMSPTPTKSFKDNLDWSEMEIDDDNSPTPTQFLATQPASEAITMESILDMISDFRRETVIFQSKQHSKIDSLVSLLDTVVNRNIELERKMEQLAQRVSSLESGTPSNPSNLNPISSDFPSPAVNIANQSSSSWATIARLPTPVAQEKAIRNSQLPSRTEGFVALKGLARKPLQRIRNDVQDTAVVYVAGFEFQKYGPIWKALRLAKFQTSRIHNMQWIGKSILEFVVSDDYETQFSSEIEVAGFKIRSFDASKNINASSSEQALLAKKTFVVRCVKNILFSRSITTRNHFRKVADAACAADEETKTIFEKEYDVASTTRNDDIATLVDSLELGNLSDEDYAKSIWRLSELDSDHLLVKAYRDLKNAGMGSTDDHHTGDH
jgi:hypothetical protein